MLEGPVRRENEVSREGYKADLNYCLSLNKPTGRIRRREGERSYWSMNGSA